MSLSLRGNKAADSILRFDLETFFEAVQNLYHKEFNPDGTFPLNVAENKLCWTELKTKMQEITAREPIPDWVSRYTSAMGHHTVRQVIANFLSRHLTGCPMNPDNIGMSAGATSVIEMTSMVLGDPGDVAVFPAPCYPVYKADIGHKAGVERYDLITHHELSEIQNGPALQISHLEKTLEDIHSQGKRFRFLVLTTPDNPTGGAFDFDQLITIADWCIKKGIHLIVNEIYGLSLIDTSHPDLREDYPNHPKFKSFANIMAEKQSDFLHLWYAFSKDFGASGFRIGLVYSHNKKFLKAYGNFNAPNMVSNYTQWVFERVLKDDDFITHYIKTNQQRLTESYATAIQVFRELDIPYIPAVGSLFIWIDLSEFLNDQTQAAENEFWLELYRKTGILLTPGEGFGHSKKGQFRVVYPCVPLEDLKVALGRFKDFVNMRRNIAVI
ncbi:MAG: aminotransferase class I/II-fold pyridoxal phosphate-dependent enzyme [Bacteroidetes bacterium]|nr:MAG: aminotransferase class I/II-fold pyridoxal phosphate-dependent enzyme [Bacteroidota bacterium]